MKPRLNKLLHTIASLKVALTLLSLIAMYIVIGTLLPQHSAPEWYLERYPTIGPAIVALSLDSAYSSTIFIILVALFSLNLCTCTILSLRPQLKQMEHSYHPALGLDWHAIEAPDARSVHEFLTAQRYRTEAPEGETTLRAGKYRWGVLGATITHIGLLILFVGGTIGNMTASEDIVNLLPGNQHRFEQEGFTLTLDDFHMTFDEQGSVRQYISTVTLDNDDGTSTTSDLWVNNPLHHKGLGIYQASFGWTGNLRITDTKNGEVVAQGLLRSGRTYFHQEAHLTVYLYGYYPEMAVGHDQQPVSLSNRETNPYYALVLYEFGNPVGSYVIAPGEVILHNGLEITFTHAVAYTGLLVRSDPSYPVVLTGFLVILLGMFISFYCYPRFISYADGTLRTASRRNGWVFHHSVRTAWDRWQKTHRRKD